MVCPKDKVEMGELAFIKYYPNKYLASVPVTEHYWKCFKCGRIITTKKQNETNRKIASQALGFNVK